MNYTEAEKKELRSCIYDWADEIYNDIMISISSGIYTNHTRMELEFLNGIKIFAGQVLGEINEEALRRIQIRETILSHIERERKLFYKGIKVLSLFFIDEVAKYRQYDESGVASNGIYAKIFEEEYKEIIGHLRIKFGEATYTHITPKCRYKKRVMNTLFPHTFGDLSPRSIN